MTAALLSIVGALFLGSVGCGGQDSLLLPDPAATSATTGKISGTITSGGVPQANVALKTVPASATTASSGSGTFTLTGVPPGKLTVVAEKAGYIREFKEVQVVADRTSQADIILFPATGAGSLGGAITDGSLALPDVEVVTVPATQTVITTADGRYLVTGAPGQYQVSARRMGYASQSRVVQILEGRTVTQNFSLGTRSDGVILGTISDRLGNVLQNARVDLFQGGQTYTAFTNTSGVYSFLNVVTGFCVLSAQADGYLPGSKGLEVAGGTTANGDMVMALTSTVPPVPGAITGTVFDRSGAPVSGITVLLNVTASPSSVLTGTDGRFKFVDVTPGPVTISATQATPPAGGPVLGNGSRSVSVGAAQTADGSLVLEEV